MPQLSREPELLEPRLRQQPVSPPPPRRAASTRRDQQRVQLARRRRWGDRGRSAPVEDPAAPRAHPAARAAGTASAALAGSLLALALVAPPSVLAERLPVSVSTTADGLAGDAVRDLLLDSRGFLWIATSSGLSRFDGQLFRTYDTPHGLPSTRIHALTETRDGTVWVATDGGLARLRTAPYAEGPPFVAEPLPPELAAGSVAYCLFEDRSGRLWVCTGGGLIVLEQPARGAATARAAALPAGDRLIGAVAQGLGGELWLDGPRGILRLPADGDARLYPVRDPPVEVAALATDTEGRVWLGLGDGFYVWRPEPPTGDEQPRPLHHRARPPTFLGELPQRPGEVLFYDRRSGIEVPFTYHITRGRGAAMLLGTGGGALRFAAGAVQRFAVSHGLPESAVTAVLEADDGTLWAGTESRGLARLPPSGLVIYGVEDGLTSDRISALLEDPHGLLYVVSFSRDLHVFDGRRFHDITPPAVRAAGGGWGWNQTVTLGPDGEWWIPAADGLHRYPPVATPGQLARARLASHYHHGNGLPGNDVFRLFADRHGALWVSTIAVPPLARVAGGVAAVVPQLTGAATGGAPTAFAEDRAGNLWMGFYLGGLARVSGDRWRFFGATEGVPAGFVSDLHLDSRGRLWVATNAGGVARIDGAESPAPRFTRFGTAQGLATDSSRCFAEDVTRGALYIGGARGIDRLELATGRVQSTTTRDGLPNNVVWVCHAASDGHLWFGSLHGLVRLDPRAVPRSPAPRVLIARLRARDEAYPLPELGSPAVAGWRLGPRQDALEIEYLALSADRGVRFQHWLEGSGDGWSAPTEARSVVFPRLAPGRYRLLVRAVARDGTLSVRPAMVSFELLPPLWLRPWFLALAVAAAALGAWGAYRLRLRRLLALERVRTRIASDLHDDVGASLSRIGLLGELARVRVRDDPAQAAEMLARIGEEAQELTEATADMVWAVDPRQDDLASLVARVRRFAAELLEARGIRLHVESPADAATLALAPELRRALHLALKEAIHNVARHSQAQQAWLRLERRDGRLHAEVRDDGVGLDPERAAVAAAAGRHGLPGLRERARAVGGEAIIEAAPQGGTRVELRLPLRPPR